MIEKGLKEMENPLTRYIQMENQGKLEVNKLEYNLTILATYIWKQPYDWFSWNCYWNDMALP